MQDTAQPTKISILLADDHALVRDGIKALLEDDHQLEVIQEAVNGEDTVQKILSSKPDIAIVDIRMPIMNGLEAVQDLTSKHTATRMIMLSMHDSEEYVLQAIEAGAMGYVLKGAPKEELLRAIHKVYNGEKYFSGDISKIIVKKYLENLQNRVPNTPAIVSKSEEDTEEIALTRREKQILELVLSGMSNKEIAERLGKSVRTVEAHRYNLMKKKLKVKNVFELSQKAKALGLI